MFEVDVTYKEETRPFSLVPKPVVTELDPNMIWGRLKHDVELGIYWGLEKNGKTRWAPRTHGDPETVTTYYKEQRVSLNSAWQEFHKLLFTLAAFGKADLALFPELEKKFDSTMAANRVITNKVGYPEGYMPLLLAGNIIRLMSETVYRPDSKFGLSYKFETLDPDKPVPDVEEVFWTKPWLWTKATVARYDTDGTSGLSNPWAHVIPFPQLDGWNAHVPLLNIRHGGWNYVQVSRVQRWTAGTIPNPYNPPLNRKYP